jgi:hypothetical protein
MDHPSSRLAGEKGARNFFQEPRLRCLSSQSRRLYSRRAVSTRGSRGVQKKSFREPPNTRRRFADHPNFSSFTSLLYCMHRGEFFFRLNSTAQVLDSKRLAAHPSAMRLCTICIAPQSNANPPQLGQVQARGKSAASEIEARCANSLYTIVSRTPQKLFMIEPHRRPILAQSRHCRALPCVALSRLRI